MAGRPVARPPWIHDDGFGNLAAAQRASRLRATGSRCCLPLVGRGHAWYCSQTAARLLVSSWPPPWRSRRRGRARRLAPFALFAYGGLRAFRVPLLLNLGSLRRSSTASCAPEPTTTRRYRAYPGDRFPRGRLSCCSPAAALAVARCAAVQQLRGPAASRRRCRPCCCSRWSPCGRSCSATSSGSAPGVRRCRMANFGILLAVAGVVLVLRRRHIAAAAAVAGLLSLGLVFMRRRRSAGSPVHLSGRPRPDLSIPGFTFAAPGAMSGLDGPVALLNQTALWLVRVEGLALIAAGCVQLPGDVRSRAGAVSVADPRS